MWQTLFLCSSIRVSIRVLGSFFLWSKKITFDYQMVWIHRDERRKSLIWLRVVHSLCPISWAGNQGELLAAVQKMAPSGLHFLDLRTWMILVDRLPWLKLLRSCFCRPVLPVTARMLHICRLFGAQLRIGEYRSNLWSMVVTLFGILYMC